MSTRPAPILSPLWPLGAIVAVLYGSLIPFTFDPAGFSLSNWWGLLGIGLHGFSHEDLVTNVMIYVPVGLSLILCGRRRVRYGKDHLCPPASTAKIIFALQRIPPVVVIGGGVSILAEALQTGISVRVASWTDVGLNTLGTLVGAILGAVVITAGISGVDRLRRRLADRPFATITALLTFGLLFIGLAPFDFIYDTGALHSSFLRVDWSLASFRPETPGGPPFEAMVAKISGAIWFALLGYFRSLSGRESGRTPLIAFASAVKHGLVLVVLVEILQIFTRSHQPDLTTLILGPMGVALGAWWAAFAVDLPQLRAAGFSLGGRLPESQALARADVSPGRAVPTMILALLAVVQVALLLAAAVGRKIGFSLPIDLSAVQWVPFEALWHRPMLQAAYAIGSSLLTYSALAITLAVIFRRSGVTRAWFITGTMVTALALGLEGLQTLTATRTADLTSPAIALLAAVTVARVYPALRAPYAAEAILR